MSEPIQPQRTWINRTIVGIILATFFSDVSHEMATAVLPFYLTSIGLGRGFAALGVIEGVADFLVSLARLGGGVVGHRVRRKRPWAALGYLLTTLATAALALAVTLAALVSLRSAAWMARGFRGPLRDFMLADAVAETHYGRAYGLERAGDMLGAVTGPLLAIALIWTGIAFSTILLWTLLPGLVAAGCMFFLTRERADLQSEADAPAAPAPAPKREFPAVFWLFLIGVGLFGMGDFSRSLLILLTADALRTASVFGEEGPAGPGVLTVAIVLAIALYVVHNLVSAAAAFPAGRAGDRFAKLPVLIVGYGIGVGTHLVLLVGSASPQWLVVAIVLSGIYIAVEETLEKAAAAQFLPRELHSLGFGVLAFANALGDMASSLYVGLLLEVGQAELAFGLAATFGSAGAIWLSVLAWRGRRAASAPASANEPEA